MALPDSRKPEKSDSVNPSPSTLLVRSQLSTYIETISTTERLEYKFCAVQDIIQEIQILRLQSSESRAHKALQIITPFVSFIDRYSRAIDNMVQFNASPASLIWGSLRVVLRLVQSLPFYFVDLFRMVERLGAQLSLYNQYYEQLFHGAEDFQAILLETYMDVLIFLRHAREALARNTAVTAWLLRTWTNFEQEFEDILNRVGHRFNYLGQLTTFLHRHSVQRDIKKQDTFRDETTRVLRQVVTSSHASQSSLDEWRTTKRVQEIVGWLSPPDVAEQWRRNKQKCAPNTCQWILKHDFFRGWEACSPDQQTYGSVGWIYGNAGIGKTILCTSLIEHLEQRSSKANRDAAVIYFYFSKTDSNQCDTLAMYRALISQIIAKSPDAIDLVESAFDAAKRYGRLRMTWSDTPAEIFKGLLERAPKTLILIDGLDECRDIEHFLGGFVDTTRSYANCRVLFFSRDIPIIRNTMGSHPVLKVTAELTQADIDVYLSGAVQGLQLTSPRLQERLKVQLLDRADGMFLWAYLMIEELKTASSPADIWAALDGVPKGFDPFYGLILNNLAKESPRRLRLAQDVFAHVLCSPRPFTWLELQYSLSLAQEGAADTQEAVKDRYPFKSAVLKVCSPFIEYHEESDTFQAAHLSVYHFLTTPSKGADDMGLRIYLPTAHRKLAKICLACLNQSGLQTQAAVECKNHPFARYATVYWCHHLLNSQLDVKLHQQAIVFLTSDSKRRIWLMRWLLLDHCAFPIQQMLDTLKRVWSHLENYSPEGNRMFDILGDFIELLVQLDESRSKAHLSTMGLGQQTTEKSDKMLSINVISNFERMMFLRDLVREYKHDDRLNDGIAHLLLAQKRLERLPGSRPIDVAWILNGLGLFYDQQDRTDLAIETQLAALAIQCGALGLETEACRFDMTLTVNELGRLHRHQGQLDEALSMHQRALDDLKLLSLPDADGQVEWTRNHIARCYRLRGDAEQALELHTMALESRRLALGAEHPHTLWTLSDIAKCHGIAGRWDLACELQAESVRLRHKVLGPRHHDVLWAMNDLGLMYEGAGRADKAVEVHRAAWQGQRETLGDDAAATRWSQHELERLTGGPLSLVK
ncbi:NACHT domain protein [Xylaria intraflava]|nr:NACHT domain protein [Xylaria intraflava]